MLGLSFIFLFNLFYMYFQLNQVHRYSSVSRGLKMSQKMLTFTNLYIMIMIYHDHDKHCGFPHDGNSLLILLHNPRCRSFEAFESAKRCNICYCCRHSHHSFLCCRHSHHSFLIVMFIN